MRKLVIALVALSCVNIVLARSVPPVTGTLSVNNTTDEDIIAQFKECDYRNELNCLTGTTEKIKPHEVRDYRIHKKNVEITSVSSGIRGRSFDNCNSYASGSHHAVISFDEAKSAQVHCTM